MKLGRDLTLLATAVSAFAVLIWEQITSQATEYSWAGLAVLGLVVVIYAWQLERSRKSLLRQVMSAYADRELQRQRPVRLPRRDGSAAGHAGIQVG